MGFLIVLVPLSLFGLIILLVIENNEEKEKQKQRKINENIIFLNTENLILTIKKAISNKTVFDLSSLKEFDNSNIQLRELVIQAMNETTVTGVLLSESVSYEFAKIISDESIKILNYMYKNNGFEEYCIVDISKTTKIGVSIGSYVYKFNDNFDLCMMRIPLNYFEHSKDVKLPVIDTMVDTSPIIIMSKEVHSFHVYGNEIGQTNVMLNNEYEKPKLFKTVGTELIFGSSYTILEGLSKGKMSLKSENQILDLREVHLILKDKTDFVFVGTRIFYDLRRVFQQDVS